MGSVFDLFQGVNKGFWAGGAGAPVDTATLALNALIAGGGYVGHKAGLLKAPPELIEKPVGGSEWIAEKMRSGGLLQDNPGSTADNFGNVIGGLLGPVTAAKAPQIARGLLQAEANAMAPTRLSKQAGLVVVDSSEQARAGRMANMGMGRGWYRGGAEIQNGKRSGPMYTQDAGEAANYAKRFGANADIREYALPNSGFLQAERAYPSRLAHDVGAIVDDVKNYGKPGAQLASELKSFGPGEGITGGQLWQALESRFGNDGAAEILSKLQHQGRPAFNGAKGMTRGDEAYVFKHAPVRDANKAAFNPDRAGVDDIYGKINLPMLGLLGAGGLAANRLANKD